MCPQSPLPIVQGSPRQRRTLHRRGLEKLALNSGTNRRSAKNDAKSAKKSFTAAITSTAASRVPFSVAQLECPLSPAKTESEALPLSQPSLRDHRDERTVDELRQQGHRPPCQMCCNCGTIAVLCTLTPSICRCTPTGMSTTLSKHEYDELQLWELGCLLTVCARLVGPAQQTSITLSMYCNWRISMENDGESASAPRQRCRRT